ncbi:MAG TPA: hypothetical protein PK323_07055 [Bacteroidia bacterium]|nr:hypothetical protein [Bacteroidia bacterium]
METNSKNKKYKKFFFFIPMLIFGLSAISFIVMQLWNWLMPVIFQLPSISFFQAAGLFALSKILFSSFNFNGRNKRGPFNNQEMNEKIMNMSEEERAAFKAQWKQRCGK